MISVALNLHTKSAMLKAWPKNWIKYPVAAASAQSFMHTISEYSLLNYIVDMKLVDGSKIAGNVAEGKRKRQMKNNGS